MGDGPTLPPEQAGIRTIELRRRSFEEQFNLSRKSYESLGGIIDAVFVKPENPKSAIPVIIAPGWSETKEVFKETIEHLYNAGRSVIALDHPRKGGTVDPREEYPIDELRKALTIQEIVNQEDIPKIDIISHSEGSINGAIAAALQPEKVRNMILFNPAGLIGKDSLLGLLGRFTVKNIRNITDNITDRDAVKRALMGQIIGARYILENPLRAAQEVRAISQTEIDGTLKELHDEGIGIVIIHGVDDPGFPMDRMQRVVKSAKNPDGFVDGFLSVKGGHDELYIHPEKYTKAAEEMLTALEKKQEAKLTKTVLSG